MKFSGSRRCAKPPGRCVQADERGGQSCGSRENSKAKHNFKYNFLIINNLKVVK
jgi:hypothetical protein